jgi:hypothetical protein
MAMLKSILQGSHLAWTTTELEKRAAEWAEIFAHIIPEDRLRDCYVAAELNQNRRPEDASFPLRRREIVEAWYRLQAAAPTVVDDECDFCELYFKDPNSYQPCPFHRKAADLVGR